MHINNDVGLSVERRHRASDSLSPLHTSAGLQGVGEWMIQLSFWRLDSVWRERANVCEGEWMHEGEWVSETSVLLCIKEGSTSPTQEVQHQLHACKNKIRVSVRHLQSQQSLLVIVSKADSKTIRINQPSAACPAADRHAQVATRCYNKLLRKSIRLLVLLGVLFLLHIQHPITRI